MNETLEKKNIMMKLNGVRQTSQRRATLQYLSSTNSHPTANKIYNILKKDFPKLSLATVYQNLKTLTKNNVIKEISVKNMPNRYDFNTENHYHIVCQSCGEIHDFVYPVFHEVEEIASHLFNFNVFSHSLEIYGLCKTCQKTASDKFY